MMMTMYKQEYPTEDIDTALKRIKDSVENFTIRDLKGVNNKSCIKNYDDDDSDIRFVEPNFKQLVDELFKNLKQKLRQAYNNDVEASFSEKQYLHINDKVTIKGKLYRVSKVTPKSVILKVVK